MAIQYGISWQAQESLSKRVNRFWCKGITIQIVIIVIASVSILFLTPAYTQQYEPCVTPVRQRQIAASDPDFTKRLYNRISSYNKIHDTHPERLNSTLGTIVIPVVFHLVLHDSLQLADSIIIKQLKIVNDAYAGINEDMIKVPVDFTGLPSIVAGIHFPLAFINLTPSSPSNNGPSIASTSFH